MRLIFEISNLSQASPATVSRAGILFINETDVGWGPFVQSWIDVRTRAGRRGQFAGSDRVALMTQVHNNRLSGLNVSLMLKFVLSHPVCASRF